MVERGGAGSAPSLPARAAYRLWAPAYQHETALSALEDRVVRSLTPPFAGRSLLDAGCGTGRRLPGPDEGILRAVGVDLVPEMLLAEGGRRPPAPLLAAGDVRALPFRPAVFDLLWCRLVLGHLDDVGPGYRELARVAARGAFLVVSDFHPDAVAAGHERTFRDPSGRLRTVEHHVHRRADHERAAAEAGWQPLRALDAPAGEAERAFYERAGRLAEFDAERALPLVLVMCFRL